jgi:uncharacterized membrane protein YgdD (TMEM256/DUF423 family)
MNRFAIYAVVAALSGAVSVMVGAFAAHGVSDPHARELLDIAARYQATHTMASIASLTFWRWGATRARHAPPLFFAGIVLFCGALDALAFGAPPAVGAITPVGGVLFIAGWLTLAWAGLQLKPRGDAP